MKQIYSSASKIAFLMIIASACAGFGFGRLSENNFMILAGAAVTYYFTKPKGDEKIQNQA